MHAVLVTHWLTHTPGSLAKPNLDQEWSTLYSGRLPKVQLRSSQHEASMNSSISRMSQTPGYELFESTLTDNEQAVEHSKESRMDNPPKISVSDALIEEVFGSSGNKRAMNPSTRYGRRTSLEAAEIPSIGSGQFSGNAVVHFMTR